MASTPPGVGGPAGFRKSQLNTSSGLQLLNLLRTGVQFRGLIPLDP